MSKASWMDNHLTDLIQPPSLRAPEVIIGADWGTGADVWSAACVASSCSYGLDPCFIGNPDLYRYLSFCKAGCCSKVGRARMAHGRPKKITWPR